jgi:hypothetical protein
MRFGINLAQISGDVNMLTSSRESQMFLMTCGMMNPFQKVYN